MNEAKHIAIVGAGPTGLMAAEKLAEAGLKVTVYDKMPSPARKLLMAGCGGLNLTHSEQTEAFMPRYGNAAQWLEPSIYEFPPKALRAWCEGLGQETFIGSSGRVFPKAMKAAPLLRAWLRRLGGLGVRFVPSYTWCGWEGEQLVFYNAAQQKQLVQADATLLALGGASWPRLGSNGNWVQLLQDTGVEIAPLRPANCGFVVVWSTYFSSRFAGQPLKPVSITHNGITRQGEAMITAKGMEGSVVYALSAALRASIEAEGKAVVALDMRPSMTREALTQKLQNRRDRQSISVYLQKAGLSPLTVALLHESMTQEEFTHADPTALAARLKALPLTFTATAGMTRAISSAGGIRQEAVDEHFMLRAKQGVFVAGEMLDWEAPTGGYLLQGCFSTAVAAAEGIKLYLVPIHHL